MTLSKSIRRGGNGKLLRAMYSGKFSAPAPEPVPVADPKPDPEPDNGPKPEKTFTQADLNKIGAKQKAEGKAAAEKAVSELLGCSPAEAAEILKKHREAEDATKSEAEKALAKAEQAAKDAEAAKADAAKEMHEARIERALAAAGFTADDSEEGQKKLGRVRKMVTVAVGAPYEDVLADVQDAKQDFPALFAGDAPAGGGGKPPKVPSSDPRGKPPAPNSGESKFDAGKKRYQEQANKHQGYNPLEKKTT